MRTTLLALTLCCLSCSTRPNAGSSAALSTEHYYRSDHLTGAEYLRLDGTGRYSVTGVEHMGSWDLDQGHWELKGDGLLLHSNSRVLDIVSPPFRVYIHDFDELALLRSLKAHLRAYLDAHGTATSLSVPELLEFQRSVPDDGYSSHLSVHLDIEAEFSGAPVPIERLYALLGAIDRYEQGSDPRTFPYQLLHYRGLHLLVGTAPGGVAVLDTPDSVRARIDEANGEPPPYLFVEIARDEYDAGVRKHYPFKFYPGMNE